MSGSPAEGLSATNGGNGECVSSTSSTIHPRFGDTSPPILVLLSSHHLLSISEVVFAPLIRDWTKGLKEIDLVIQWGDEPLLLAVSELFTLEALNLRQRAGDLQDQEDAIRRALERLFTGF